MTENETLARARKEFTDMVRSRFSPSAHEADALYDAGYYKEMRDEVNDYAESIDQGFANDNGAVFDEMNSALRVITTGRSRLPRLFESHRFDEALEAIDNSSLDDQDFAHAIRDWNPPSQRTADAYSGDYLAVAELANELIDLANDYMREFEHDEASDSRSFINNLRELSNHVHEMSGCIAGIVSHRDAICQSKRVFVSEAKRAKLLSRSARDDSFSTQPMVVDAVNFLSSTMTDIDQLFRDKSMTDEITFGSKKRLLDSQKSWNVAARELRDAWFNVENTVISARRACEGCDYLSAEIVADHVGRIESAIDDFWSNEAQNKLNTLAPTLDENEFVNFENQSASLRRLIESAKKLSSNVDEMKAKVEKLKGLREDY